MSGSFDKTVRVWDADMGVQIGSPLQGHTLSDTSVAFSPDGLRIVSGSFDKTLRVWDARRGVRISNNVEGNGSARSADGYTHLINGESISHFSETVIFNTT